MSATADRPPAPRRAPHIRLLAALSALLAALLVSGVVGPALQASAHAQLLSSDPADGASLAAPPTRIEFTYNEDINPAFAQVLVRDAAGTNIQISAPQVTGPIVRVTLQGAVPAGRVTAAYRVTSKDGHPIAGQIAFTVATGATGSSSGVGSTSAPDSRSAAPTPAATLAGAPTSADTDSLLPMYLLAGAGAIGLMVLGGLVLWWERKRVTR